MTSGIPALRFGGCRTPEWLPSTAELLVQGGDMRIALDPQLGVNKYGCRPQPDEGLLAFGSSTASVISEAGFAAADALRQKLLLAAGMESPAGIYAREINRQRRELIELSGLSALEGLECIFAASGTDVHLLASQLASNVHDEPPLVVMTEAAETGSGVPAALSGRHFSSRSALGASVSEGEAMAGSIEVATVPVRYGDGTLRETAEVDAEVEARVVQAVAASRRVLLVLTDVSKTGLITPSLSCVMALQRRLGDAICVLVDACQFRLASATLRAYLGQGYMVALTGSKFVGGPSFSGALLVPEPCARRLRWRALPSAVAAYSSRAEWPASWAAADTLGDDANFGLLLRWEAALEELRRFHVQQEAKLEVFLKTFADAVDRRLADDPSFEPLPVAQIDRRPLSAEAHWDEVQTIFPFLLFRLDDGDRQALSSEETREVYRLLQTDLSGKDDLLGLRCQLGQPVACGERGGEPVSALRLCMSARLVVEALQGRADQVIAQAMAALDKAALIVASMK